MNREMQEVLENLDRFISKRGFAYALLMAQIEDVSIDVDLIDQRNNQKRLSSNEILFLWSLLVNKEDIWQYPDTKDDLYDMRCEITQLMEKMHFSFWAGMRSYAKELMEGKTSTYNPYKDGTAFQEAIFYSGGSLYDEEYIYYVKKRYVDDVLWLEENKGYYIDAFCDIVCRIKQTISEKDRKFRMLSLPETLDERMKSKPEGMIEEMFVKQLTMWQFFYSDEERLTLEEYCDRLKSAISFEKKDIAGLEKSDDYLRLFCLEPTKACNAECKEPGDYSILMSKPIIATGEDQYVVLEMHQLFKSLYDVPGYWLKGVLNTHKKMGKHVGDFSESQTQKVLKKVFREHCYSNIVVKQGKKDLTDIDVLCVWRNYGLCFQIKSKGLRLSSKQGDIETILSDFSKSFQSAYNQGLKCREALINQNNYTFVKKETGEVVTMPKLRDVYIICETSDEYPSLTHQMSVMLDRKDTDPKTMAINLFDIDIMAKYLNKPYYFVHYVGNRLKNSDVMRSDVETNYLSAYTHNRLCLEGMNYDSYMFDNSFAKELDAELMPQYEKMVEEVKVDNRRWRDETFDTLIEEMDATGQEEICEVILEMLNIGENDVKAVGKRLRDGLAHKKDDRLRYDSFHNSKFGFTFIVMPKDEPDLIKRVTQRLAIVEMENHHARNWIGIAHIQESDNMVDALVYIKN